jgi:hypothetical protein
VQTPNVVTSLASFTLINQPVNQSINDNKQLSIQPDRTTSLNVTSSVTYTAIKLQQIQRKQAGKTNKTQV